MNYRLSRDSYHKCLGPVEGCRGPVWHDVLLPEGTTAELVKPPLRGVRLATLRIGETYIYAQVWSEWQSVRSYAQQQRRAAERQPGEQRAAVQRTRRREYVRRVWPAAKPKRA